MTLAELLDTLQVTTDDGKTFHERDGIRGYIVRWHNSEDEVARVRVDHDTRTVWLDH